MILPFVRKLSGRKRKILIGDNLRSHFSHQMIFTCIDNNIAFVCLPLNATHLCQPLNLSVFGPMKIYIGDMCLRNGRLTLVENILWRHRNGFCVCLMILWKKWLRHYEAALLVSGFRKCIISLWIKMKWPSVYPNTFSGAKGGSLWVTIWCCAQALTFQHRVSNKISHHDERGDLMSFL